MSVTEFPAIPVTCPENCRPEIDEAVFLLLTAAINGGTGISLKTMLERIGLTEFAWRHIRPDIAAHFPDHEITHMQTSLKGPRLLKLVPKRHV